LDPSNIFKLLVSSPLFGPIVPENRSMFRGFSMVFPSFFRGPGGCPSLAPTLQQRSALWSAPGPSPTAAVHPRQVRFGKFNGSAVVSLMKTIELRKLDEIGNSMIGLMGQ
jgi:hypothetical protein